MNTIKGSPLGTNKETARNLLDVRIILAVLWVAGMLSSLNGDTYRLSAATEPLGVNPGLFVDVRGDISGSRFYECLDPDVEVSRESLGKPHHRHILCCDYSCFWVLHLLYGDLLVMS